MKTTPYRYLTNCTQSTYEAITAMQESAREIQYATLLRHVGIDELCAVFPWYARQPSQGLTLKNDWHVSYHVSRYQGQKCYYVQHSRIEYIWTRDHTEAADA